MSQSQSATQRLRALVEHQPSGDDRLVNVVPADVRALCEAVEADSPIKAAFLLGTRRLPGDVTRVAVRADDLRTLLSQVPVEDQVTDPVEVPA